MDNSINEDDLFFEDDLSTLNGIPFSGVSHSMHKNGQLEVEYHYKDGFRDGLCREWYPNGQLQKELIARRGQALGKIRTWHENGKLKSIAIAEFGAELEYDEWDKIGNLVATRRIDKRSFEMEYVRIMRERNSQ